MALKKPRALRVLMAASEGVPFSKTGGLADVIGALPAALAAEGCEIAVVLPRYRSTKLENPQTLMKSLSVSLGSAMHFPAILEAQSSKAAAEKSGAVRWLFVDYPTFFDRESLYVGADGKDYPDNPARFALFSRCVLEIAKSVFAPDLIHCHDWQSGLAPLLLKTLYASDPSLQKVPSVFTIHNLGYQGLFPSESLAQAGLPPELFTLQRLEFYGKVNFLKGALVHADFLTTVSRRHAEEIQTPEFGFGLDGILRERVGVLRGILNGVDYSEWDPSHDRYTAAPFTAASLEGKEQCKREVLREFELPDGGAGCPLIGIVSRFTRQKGADLIAEAAERMLAGNIRLIALGTGEEEYENLFRDLAHRYPGKVAVKIAYDNGVAHRIEAGADMFLMPSNYEPCGLNQIYSLRYGTVPVVRATGGLDDTIEQYDPQTNKGTGFKFSEYSGSAMLGAVVEASGVFSNRERWRNLMRNGMEKDFSWKASSLQYARLYEEALGKPSAPAETRKKAVVAAAPPN